MGILIIYIFKLYTTFHEYLIISFVYIPVYFFTRISWNKFSGLKNINISKVFEMYFQIILLKSCMDL